jgi:mannose-6-phosphate isomerase-like protein (cupin superfamily)
MRGGNGSVDITDLASKDELLNKCRLFSRLSMKPGCGIGYHVHENETEIFIIGRGTALYNDGGTEVEVKEGDVMIAPVGTGHAIKNSSESETLEIIALIILA